MKTYKNSTEKLLEIRNLHIVYKGAKSTVYAVNGLILTLNKGETLGLVGETGAGKTTTALSIIGLLPKRNSETVEGTILFEDTDLLNIDEHQMQRIRGNDISMIFQDPMTSLNPTMKISDQIAEVLKEHNSGMTKEQIGSRVDEMLGMIGIDPVRKNEYPHQFSGGMKQRVVIAIGLACQPKLLLADEPTTALDVTVQAQVLEMIKTQREKIGTALLLITHDLGVVAQTCDRAAIMYAGSIVEEGVISEIFDGNNHHPYTKGLFASIPDLTKQSDRLSPILGSMPDSTKLPDGCAFYERCKYRMDLCNKEKPTVTNLSGHKICCHLFNDDMEVAL